MVKIKLQILFLTVFISACGTVEHDTNPLDEVIIKVGEQVSINLHDLGVSINACNYTIKESLKVERLIEVKHINLHVQSLDNILITGNIRGFTQLRVEYENCAQDPLFRNTYIKYIDILITE